MSLCLFRRGWNGVQRVFAEQLPLLPLCLRLKLGATRPDLKGFIMDPTENSAFWNIEEFGLDAD